MGRGRSGTTKQTNRNTRSDFVIKKNASLNYSREAQKKEVTPLFPPEFIEALGKIDPLLFAYFVLDS